SLVTAAPLPAGDLARAVRRIARKLKKSRAAGADCLRLTTRDADERFQYEAAISSPWALLRRAASRCVDAWEYLGVGFQFHARNISHIHAQRSFARVAWLATAGDAEPNPRHRRSGRQRHERRLAASLYAPEAFQG